MDRPDVSQAIDLLRSESLSRLVEREVERLILGGELSPGRRLNEGRLAQRQQVSRGPVRQGGAWAGAHRPDVAYRRDRQLEGPRRGGS